jgi:hypothetical protein
MIQHQAGLHQRGAALDVDIENGAQMLAGVDHQGRAHRLAALAGAGAARQHRHFQLAGDGDGVGDVTPSPGNQHAHGHDLIDRGIGGVAAPVRIREQNLPFRLGAQPAGQGDADFIGDSGRQHGRRPAL